MKQIELESKLRDMRAQRDNELAPIRKRIETINEEYAQLRVQEADIIERKARLNQERKMYGRYYNELNQTHNTAIRQFAKDNEDCTRALADVSDWALFNELRARGYHGKVWNTARDDEFMETINNKILDKDDEQEK
jgi:hypothetical protein